jgi:hypothetical protein
MQFLRLTPSQKKLKRWREKRNHLVCQLLEKDRTLLRSEALRRANAMMGKSPK